MAALALCSVLGVYRRRLRGVKAGGGSGVAFAAVYALLYLLITL